MRAAILLVLHKTDELAAGHRRKMTKQTRIALILPLGDARYALESVADAMLKSGMKKRHALPALRTAVKRLLNVALMDADLKISRKALGRECQRIAVKLLAA
jgi:hypothetical protein